MMGMAGPYRLHVGPIKLCVYDGEGQRVLVVPNPYEGEAEWLQQAIEAANAYPRLKAQLDKALEACKLMEAAARLQRFAQHQDVPLALTCYSKSHEVIARATSVASEALEMAEGRDGDEQAQQD